MARGNKLDHEASARVLIRGFWAHLASRRKHQLGVLLILMIIASFAEVLSLGAVLPFLGILTTQEKVFSYPTRSEARRVGKGLFSTCRSRWSPEHEKKRDIVK